MEAVNVEKQPIINTPYVDKKSYHQYRVFNTNQPGDAMSVDLNTKNLIFQAAAGWHNPSKFCICFLQQKGITADATHMAGYVAQYAMFNTIEFKVGGNPVETSSYLQELQRCYAPIFYDNQDMTDAQFYFQSIQDKKTAGFHSPVTVIAGGNDPTAAQVIAGVDDTLAIIQSQLNGINQKYVEPNAYISQDYLGGIHQTTGVLTTETQYQKILQPGDTGQITSFQHTADANGQTASQVLGRIYLKHLLPNSIFQIDEFLPFGDIELTLNVNNRKMMQNKQHANNIDSPNGDILLTNIRLLSLQSVDPQLPRQKRMLCDRQFTRLQNQTNQTIFLRSQYQVINHLLFGFFPNTPTVDLANGVNTKYFTGLIRADGTKIVKQISLDLNTAVLTAADIDGPQFHQFLIDNVTIKNGINQFLRKSNSFILDFRKNKQFGQQTSELVSNPTISFQSDEATGCSILVQECYSGFLDFNMDAKTWTIM